MNLTTIEKLERVNTIIKLWDNILVEEEFSEEEYTILLGDRNIDIPDTVRNGMCYLKDMYSKRLGRLG